MSLCNKLRDDMRLALIIFIITFVFTPLTGSDMEHEAIIPVADTYVDPSSVNSAYGQEDYLEVSDYREASEYARAGSIAVLMFDISKVTHVLSASSEITLRLYMHTHMHSPYHAMPYIPARMRMLIGVRWCENKTWNEENLTFASFGECFRPKPESVVEVRFIDVWYEWKVTDFVSKAMKKNHEEITLTLEVMPPSEGLARFASKDHTTQKMREYSPQLVFTYREPKAYSLDIVVIGTSGSVTTVAIVFLAYRLSRRHARRKEAAS